MAKTKTKKKGAKKNVQKGWEQYFGTNDDNFAKWQQLGRDLGIPEQNLTSKTQIRKVSAFFLLLGRNSLDASQPPHLQLT